MEIEHEQFRRDGFFFDATAFRLDVYRLLTAFFATSEFAKLSRVPETEALGEFASEFQEFEITRLVVAVATTVRVVQDRDRAHSGVLSASCGRLTPDIRVRDTVPLVLREASNKVIHARRFNFDAKPLPRTERTLPNPTYVLRPLLHLYGRQKGVDWKAELQVVQFASAALAVVRG